MARLNWCMHLALVIVFNPLILILERSKPDKKYQKFVNISITTNEFCWINILHPNKWKMCFPTVTISPHQHRLHQHPTSSISSTQPSQSYRNQLKLSFNSFYWPVENIVIIYLIILIYARTINLALKRDFFYN